jgi:hypothetical protein
MLLLSAAALIFTAAPNSSAATESNGGTSEMADSEDALRFRSEMGFESSDELVDRAAADTSNYTTNLVGIPISKAEDEEILRRAQVSVAIGDLGLTFSNDPTFGGTYIDQRGGGIGVFLFTDGLEARSRDIAARIGPGIEWEARPVHYSQTYLLNLQAAIERDRRDLVSELGLVSTAIWTTGNAVMVGLEDPIPETKATLIARYGAGLAFRVDRASQADACNNDHDCRPMKGGLEINPRLNVIGTGARCTSGFVVRDTNDYYKILTAGHCIEYYDGYGSAWYHNDDMYGHGRYETFGIGATRTADVGLTTIADSEIPAITNQIYTGNGNIRFITGTRGLWDWPEQGEVQRYGTNSGWDQGTIRFRNVSRPSTVQGYGTMTITQAVEVSFDSRGGDSGGPVYAVAPSGGANRLALGTHVHSDDETVVTNPHGWYSPEDVGRALYASLTPGAPYVICSGILSVCN